MRSSLDRYYLKETAESTEEHEPLNYSHKCPLVVVMLNVSKCWIRATLWVNSFLGHSSLLDVIKSLLMQLGRKYFVTDKTLNCIYIKIQPTRSQM